MKSLLSFGVLSWVLLSQPAQGNDWMTDYEKALSQAKRQDKVVLTLFTGSDWCHWCVRLEKEVFAKHDFKSWSKKNAILLKLDFPKKTKLSQKLKEQNEALAEKFGVRGFPTVVALNSKGQEVVRSGYVKGGSKAWIKDFESKLDQASASEKAWSTDFDQSKFNAKKYDRPMMVLFTGSDWCHWCQKLEQEVFKTKEFLSWADKNVELVKLDYPRRTKLRKSLVAQNKKLAERYEIQGYPTVLFMDHRGRVLAKTGYVQGGPKAWIKSAEGLIAKTR